MEYKFDERLYSLRHLVENSFCDLLSTINSGVNLLFWEIGTIIKNNLKDELPSNDEFYKDLSNSLSPIFGSYLDSSNLSLMKSFSENCSVSTIGQISEALNWNYIPHFLNLKEEKEWLFYLDKVHQESLTPDQLKNEILKKQNKDEATTQQKILERSDLKKFYLNSRELYFRNSGDEMFQKLFEPKAKNDPLLSSFLSKSNTNKTAMDTYNLIHEFQTETHYVLNMQFNLLMWSIGGSVLRLASKLNVSKPECIEKCIQEFGDYFPSIFNKDELSFCIMMAEQYHKPSDVTGIAEVVSWPYIKIILTVSDSKKQDLIARQVLNLGLGVDELKSKINSNFFDLSAIGIRSNGSEKRKGVTTETRDGNSITAITEHMVIPVTHPVHDVNRNIYKTKELLNFLTNNNYN